MGFAANSKRLEIRSLFLDFLGFSLAERAGSHQSVGGARRLQRMAFTTVEALAAKPFIQKALANPAQVYSVLSFFFGVDLPHQASQLNENLTIETMQPLWYGGGPAYDALCQPFAETIRQVGSCKTLEQQWNDSVDGKMAQLILTDQLSRNVFRGTPEAFAYEDVSIGLARTLHDDSAATTPGELYAAYRGFVATALMHSEELSDQEKSIAVLQRSKELFPDMAKGFDYQIQFATDHKLVVERFGRFPHRNRLKNRVSTPEEEAWLKDTDNLPGWAKSQG